MLHSSQLFKESPYGFATIRYRTKSSYRGCSYGLDLSLYSRICTSSMFTSNVLLRNSCQMTEDFIFIPIEAPSHLRQSLSSQSWHYCLPSQHINAHSSHDYFVVLVSQPTLFSSSFLTGSWTEVVLEPGPERSFVLLLKWI